MAVAIKINYPGTDISAYDKALEGLGFEQGVHDAPGLLFHWVNTTDDGFTVHDVWESREQFDTFVAERLAPNAEAWGMPEPKIESTEVYSYLQPPS